MGSKKGGGGSLFVLVGVVGLLVGLVWFAQRVHFEQDALRTTAEVLAVARERSGGTGSSRRIAVYRLTLAWTDREGRAQRTVPQVRSSTYDVPVGTVLEIDYDPEDPSDVRVRSPHGPWLLPSLIVLGSALLMGVGILAQQGRGR